MSQPLLRGSSIALFVLTACSRPTRSVEPAQSVVPEVVVVAPEKAEHGAARSATDATASTFDAGGACEELFAQADPCATFRNLLLVHQRPELRRCIGSLTNVLPPEYSIHCSWITPWLGKQAVGHDCYTRQPVSGGIRCTASTAHSELPEFAHYDQLRERLQGCFKDWHHEETNNSKISHELAFALHNERGGDLIQVCRQTWPGRTIDEGERHEVRLEFYPRRLGGDDAGPP